MTKRRMRPISESQGAGKRRSRPRRGAASGALREGVGVDGDRLARDRAADEYFGLALAVLDADLVLAGGAVHVADGLAGEDLVAELPLSGDDRRLAQISVLETGQMAGFGGKTLPRTPLVAFLVPQP